MVPKHRASNSNDGFQRAVFLTIEYIGLGTGGEEASLFAMDIFRM